jgi:hypothetical protein
LRGQQFSSAFYTELGGHTHTATSAAQVDLHHSHGGTTDVEIGGGHTHDIEAGGDSPVKERQFQMTGTGAPINYGRTNPPQLNIAPHQHTFSTGPALTDKITVTMTLDRFGAPGIDAGQERKQFLNKLQFAVDGQDRTSGLLRLVPGASLGDGTANDPLVKTGTGVIDITGLIPLSTGTHELRFTVTTGGGKLVYDVFCE